VNAQYVYWVIANTAFLAALSFFGMVLAIGSFWSDSGFWAAMPRFIATVVMSLYGTVIFHVSNERDWPDFLGLASYAMPMAFGAALLDYYVFHFGGTFFAPFVFLSGWLLCRYIHTTIPE
jgi:hypothetical protein